MHGETVKIVLVISFHLLFYLLKLFLIQNNTVTCSPSLTSLSYATEFLTGLQVSVVRC